MLLFEQIASAYGNDPARWASANGAQHPVVRAALPYSLKQLSDWLARGGLAQGTPPPCACMLWLCYVKRKHRRVCFLQFAQQQFEWLGLQCLHTGCRSVP